jgi:integrase
MKRGAKLAPSTIRHRHGALARCLDWMTRKHPEIMIQNPLRLLKRGFATYSEQDAELLAQSGKEAREDMERDRRLSREEEKAICDVLEGDDRTFFIVVLETAMRMRECYTLDLSRVSLSKRTLYLDSSKNGDNRQVPLSSVAGTADPRVGGCAALDTVMDGTCAARWMIRVFARRYPKPLPSGRRRLRRLDNALRPRGP